MPREAAVVVACCTELERRGAYVLNFHGSARRMGVPDLIVNYRGKFVAIECKQPGLKPTARQQAELARIRMRGGITFTIDTVDQLRRGLDALDAQAA